MKTGANATIDSLPLKCIFLMKGTDLQVKHTDQQSATKRLIGSF